MNHHSPNARDIDAAYQHAHTAALKHMQHTSRRRRTKKTLPNTMSPPTSNDFVLFPNEKRKTAKPCETHKAKQCDSNDSPNSLARPTDLAATTNTKIDDKPKPRPRTPRHGGFRIVDLSAERKGNDTDECERKNVRPPPAPRPPRLDSPDFTDDSDSEDDSNFWACHRRPSSPMMGKRAMAG